MNKVNYQSYLFTDENITRGNVYLSNSMAFDALDVDTLNVEVFSNDLGNRRVFTVDGLQYCTSDGMGYVILNKDIRDYKYGEPITYYYNNQLVGKFYLRNIVRKNKNIFQINAISVIGIWNEIIYLGGIYEGITVRELIDDMLPDYHMNIDTAVANIPLYGWLGVQSITQSICEVLFATGASLLKDSSGNPRIAFLSNLSTVVIPDDKIYIDGSVDYRSPATTVNITEHSFYQSVNDNTVNLFDNTDGSGTVDNKLITFNKPCYDLKWDGENIPSTWKHGANYCYVTGTGILTGKEYTHSTKVFTVESDNSELEPKEVWVKEATLVSAANSANVAARVLDYRSRAEEVSLGIVIEDNRNVKPGTKVKFKDPYGEVGDGIVADMDIQMSSILKATSKIVKNYTPGHFGNNYENVQLFTSNGSWVVPSGKENIRLVIAQGGQAGQNGYNGQSSSYVDTRSTFDLLSGEGGKCGVAGTPGKILVIDISNPSGTFNISVGVGGQPSDDEGAEGNYGTHSIVTNGSNVYTSNSGAILPEGYRDVISGNTYSINGKDGINGGNGRSLHDTTCGDVTLGGTTWLAGKNYTSKIHEDAGRREYTSTGSYGSGAAYGNNGLDGQAPTTARDVLPSRPGADAQSYNVTITLGSAGWGGHGGGGAGASGYLFTEKWTKEDGTWIHTGDTYTAGATALGGAFSKGTPGGNGFVLIYY